MFIYVQFHCIFIEDCQTSHRSKRPAASLSVTMSAELPEEDLDLQSFIENGESM